MIIAKWRACVRACQGQQLSTHSPAPCYRRREKCTSETSPIRYQTLLTVTKHYLLAYTCFSFAEPSFKSLPTIELDSEIPILILRAFL